MNTQDLEQFREAVKCWRDAALPANDVEAERKAEANRLLSIIDNAGKVEAHPDDAAVDRFAAALKAKLADARAKGRGGWQDKDDCPQQRLSDMLRTHVEKGDPRDVANFAMFLHQRGESILPGHQPAPVVPASEVFRIAGGDTECEPNPTPERALEVLRDLRACYDEALCDKPAPVVDDAVSPRMNC